MNRKYKAAFFVAIVLAASTFFFFGCTNSCDYPNQRLVKVRIFNAMPDAENITVYIGGKLFVKDFPYDPPVNFGYYSTYEDGSPLQAGGALPVEVYSDAAKQNLIMKTTVNIDFHLQTLIVMGKANKILPTDPDTRKVLRLADDTRPQDANTTFMRFVHAIPDLPALDVFWKAKPDGSPNATILYGAENQYMDITSADSLKITEAGHPDHIIFFAPYTFNSKGFVLTTVVRGESMPCGLDRTVSVFLLSDAIIGNFVLRFETFGVRLANATRGVQSLSLLIKGPHDSVARGNYPDQIIVEKIGIDSISGYLGLTPSLDSIAKYYFFDESANISLDSFFAQTAFRRDSRHTIIAVENKKLGETGTSVDTMILVDSMMCQSGMGRVRIIELNPDHPQVTISGDISTTMVKKQVKFFDMPTGMRTLTLTDGTTTKNISFTVPPGRPISLYLLPATVSDPFPIKTSED
jgi:hypothetical protein